MKNQIRRSIRLPGYDYSQNGYYHITICVHNRRNMFGQIVNGNVVLNNLGEIVRNEWIKTEQIRDQVIIDEFIIMPNHIHGIIIIDHRRGASRCASTAGDTSSLGSSRCASTAGDTSSLGSLINIPLSTKKNFEDINEFIFNDQSEKFYTTSQTVGAIVRGFKGSTTKKVNQLLNTPGEKVWQRNYYEHIIRSEDEYFRILEYIKNNARSCG